MENFLETHPCYPCQHLSDKPVEHVPGIVFHFVECAVLPFPFQPFEKCMSYSEVPA